MKQFIYKLKRYLVYKSQTKWGLKKRQRKWRKHNPHNKTRMINYFPEHAVSVGKYTYGDLRVHYFENEKESLKIGNFCSIGPDVEFFLGGEHHPKMISNYPFALYVSGCETYQLQDRRTKGPIVIEDDVWIGAHCLIMSGVRIGQGAIIAAGSVVTKDVPPYAIYTTNRILKYRFEPEIIEQLLKVNYDEWDDDFIRNNLHMLYTEDVKDVLENLNKAKGEK